MESLRGKISRVTRHREVPTFCEFYLLELAHDLTVNIGEKPPCASHRGRGRQPFLNTSEPSVLLVCFGVFLVEGVSFYFINTHIADSSAMAENFRR